MAIAIDLGSVTIDNPKISRFVQGKSTEELKVLFLNFLSTKASDPTPDTPNHPWENFAKEMRGVLTPDAAEHLRKTHQEFREDFALRDLES